MSEQKIRIILADDHVLVRDGIKALLEDQEDLEVVNEASDGLEALKILEKKAPDLLIVDIRMPEMNGIEVVRAIKKQGLAVKTLVLSMHDSEEYVLQSVEAGADGYLLKGSSKDEFLKALHTVYSGGKYFSGDVSSILVENFISRAKSPGTVAEDKFSLTKRERQILSHVLKGKSNKQIAEELNISKRTAEVHRFNLMKKLQVKNLIELANKAKEYGLS
ncbi:response regulator transcription factor [Sinomicrobium weinanense]|uniref:Response regulator transcription factor n=1 Tax=Sinomicrobium weinanense TaxID=2842200 RepID=A0A926JQB7_9FLAO|nr:response regulator transcription factor [Sinomicrobium weinanense]MBC9795530.1 response regulator transcription factor [Sinomicrobium weinanense]MBU3123323.1 response regulator transcription factor [Sinomicrobium weinanense]